MVWILRVIYFSIFITITAATYYASQHESVFDAFVRIGKDRWGFATLLDVYFALFTLCLWVGYRERALVGKIFWVLFILSFGNIAVAIYLLIQLFQFKANDSLQKLLFKKENL